MRRYLFRLRHLSEYVTETPKVCHQPQSYTKFYIQAINKQASKQGHLLLACLPKISLLACLLAYYQYKQASKQAEVSLAY